MQNNTNFENFLSNFSYFKGIFYKNHLKSSKTFHNFATMQNDRGAGPQIFF